MFVIAAIAFTISAGAALGALIGAAFSQRAKRAETNAGANWSSAIVIR
jgi:hypothetical protein